MDYSKLKVAELKDELKTRGLSTAGLKKDLVQRLTEADAQQAEPASTDNVDENLDSTEATERTVEATDTLDTSQAVASDVATEATSSAPQPELKQSETETIKSELGTSEQQDEVTGTDGSKSVETAETKPLEPTNQQEDISVPEQQQKEVATTEQVEPSVPLPAKRRLSDESEQVAKRTKDENEHVVPDTKNGDEATLKAEVPPESELPKSEAANGDADQSAIELARNPNTPIARYKPTRSVYIQNFSRPLNIPSLKAHLEKKAGSKLTNFWIDSIRTHCYAVFDSVLAAAKVRENVYGITFPIEERGRKTLVAEYVPDDKVEEWIAFEESDRGKTRKWEISFGIGHVDTESIRLIEAGAKPQSLNSIRDRMNPRALPFDGPSRANSTLDQPPEIPTTSVKGEYSKKTVTRPVIYYSEVAPGIAQERLQKLRSK